MSEMLTLEQAQEMMERMEKSYEDRLTPDGFRPSRYLADRAMMIEIMSKGAVAFTQMEVNEALQLSNSTLHDRFKSLTESGLLLSSHGRKYGTRNPYYVLNMPDFDAILDRKLDAARKRAERTRRDKPVVDLGNIDIEGIVASRVEAMVEKRLVELGLSTWKDKASDGVFV